MSVPPSFWKDYDVNLTLRLSTHVGFNRGTEAELEAIRPSDAIDNAIGSLEPIEGFDTLYDLFESLGFALAMPIDGEATETE